MMMPIRPQDQNPDHPVSGRQPERRTLAAKRYGKNAMFDPEADQTQPEEYKKDGLPRTTKYSVDKR